MYIYNPNCKQTNKKGNYKKKHTHTHTQLSQRQSARAKQQPEVEDVI